MEQSLRSGGNIPQLGLGTWKLKGQECESVVQMALDMGYRHIDTADGYENHREVGSGLRKSGLPREAVFLTTKVWRADLRYRQLLAACERFLGELQTDYIDLLLIHWPNSEVDMCETLEALQHLRENGRIKASGVSNFTISHLLRAFQTGVAELCVNQVELHPFLQQEGLVDFCQAHGITVTAYSPLAQGKACSHNMVRELSKKKGTPPSALILRWLMDKGLVVIPKASSREHLQANLNALSVDLSEEETRELNRLDAGERLIDPSWSEFSPNALRKIFARPHSQRDEGSVDVVQR